MLTSAMGFIYFARNVDGNSGHAAANTCKVGRTEGLKERRPCYGFRLYMRRRRTQGKGAHTFMDD
jgi:hypothetical protein